jgi:hypothetical protein
MSNATLTGRMDHGRGITVLMLAVLLTMVAIVVVMVLSVS